MPRAPHRPAAPTARRVTANEVYDALQQFRDDVADDFEDVRKDISDLRNRIDAVWAHGRQWAVGLVVAAMPIIVTLFFIKGKK